MGHTSFYVKMDQAKFGVLDIKKITPGSDPVKGGLSKGNVAEVNIEKNCQSIQPILTSQVGTGGI